MKIIQRFGNDNQLDEKFMDYLIACKNKYPNCVNEVWLTTAYGFPTLKTHAEIAQKLIAVADKLRKNGIGVSMQIANTIGHGAYMSRRDNSATKGELASTQRLIGADGTRAELSFCWNDEKFLQYVKEEVKLYAGAIQPDEIWIDDDMRATNHAPVEVGCFCDDCLKRFGWTGSREQLFDEILHGDGAVRKEWREFVCGGMARLVAEICKTIKDNSPNTRVCLQNGPNGVYLGQGYDFILNTINEVIGKAPGYRAGEGAYADHNPNDQIMKTYCLAFQNSLLPPYVDIRCPEIENLPFVVSGKTMRGTAMEATLHLASGSTCLSFSMLGYNEPGEFYEKGFELFSKNYEYWNELAKVSKNSYAGGVYYAYAKDALDRKIENNEGFRDFNSEEYRLPLGLVRNGLPLSYDEVACDVTLLYPEVAKRMSNAEIEKLLAKNVILDGKTVQYIQSRGIDLGFEVEELTEMQGLATYEIFTDNKINAVGYDEYSASFFSLGAREYCRFVSFPSDAEILGNYKDGSVSTLVFNTKKKGKWAVFGYALWKTTVPAYIKQRLYNLIDALAPTCVRVCPQYQATVFARVNKINGKTMAVSYLNPTIEKQEKVKLSLRNVQSEKFVLGSEDGFCDLTAIKNGDGFEVVLPCVQPWSVVTVFCKD
ncbi:MAG: hypothetical protein J6B79_06150 [Clostridia bacterium]|nr:hypothetical protein [Clostridia bacterium]